MSVLRLVDHPVNILRYYLLYKRQLSSHRRRSNYPYRSILPLLYCRYNVLYYCR